MSLTGGSRDVNPQFATLFITLSAANTTTTGAFPAPITRIPGGRSVTVIELLKAWVEFPQFDNIANVAETNSDMRATLTSFNAGGAGQTNSDARTIFSLVWERTGAFTAGGTYSQTWLMTQMVDLTDGAGHGVLYAADNLFFQGSTGGFAAAATFRLKLLYRFKRISLSEYVGIVQSQQG